MSDTNNSFAPDESPSATASGETTRSSEGGTKAVFATFNVLHGRIAHGPVDLNAYADAVRDLAADVVALQEVDRGMWRSKGADMVALAAQRALLPSHFFAKAWRRIVGEYGIGMITRGAMTSTGHKHVKLIRRNETRVFIESEVHLDGVEWRVYNTHLSLDADESEVQLRTLLERASAFAGPSVVMGDMNRFPEDIEPLLSGEWAMADSGPTWPSWGPHKRIDYILVRNATVESTEVRVMPVSDHCALIATVSA